MRNLSRFQRNHRPFHLDSAVRRGHPRSHTLVVTARTLGVFIDPAFALGKLGLAGEGLVGEAALVRFDYPSTDRIPLTESFNGKAYNAANDLAIDRDGGVYFSDLRKGANLPQEKAGVYYLAANGNVNRVIDDLDTPNGVILSRDERFLLVAATRELRIVRYPILQPGRLGTGETFYRFDSIEGTRLGGDGMTIDVNGNFYFAHFRGRKVDVVSPGCFQQVVHEMRL